MAATKANSIVMTEGRPLPQIIRFSVPLALTGILQLLFNAADVIVVGKFDSSTALAAVGATTSLINLLIGAFIGISVGVNILVARYLGCRDDERVSRSVHTSVVLGLGLGVVVFLLGFFLASPLLRLMDTPEDVLPCPTGICKFTSSACPPRFCITSARRCCGPSATQKSRFSFCPSPAQSMYC